MSIQEQISQLHQEVVELNKSIKGWYRYIDEINKETNEEIGELHNKIELAIDQIDQKSNRIQELINQAS